MVKEDKRLVIERVYEKRLKLAEVLKEYTGIRRIVEDLYPDSAHFIFELLQNAEDTKATEVEFELRRDCLSFEHNGREFSEDDILGITDVGGGTKSDDIDTIGRFGIGFKAVFGYTETPRIWSPSYSFQIKELVLPSALNDRTDLNSKTRFEFPFNNPKKPRDVAYREVKEGLRDLKETTLLFLNNLHSITWKIGDGEEGDLLQVPHTENHIEVLKEINGKTTASSHFLRFTRKVKGLGQTSHKVAVAFALEFIPKLKTFNTKVPIAKQMRIIPIPGQVSIFFPAKKETSGLSFHLHAPFVPELSRASIKETPANEPLFCQLADLSASSLHEIKNLGLLNRGFLDVLPNLQDTLGKRYSPIRDTIINAINEEPLMPKFEGGHSPAKYLLQAKVSLKELLSVRDLRFLNQHKEIPLQWAANRELQGTNIDRFMSDLAIRDWDVDDFLETLVENTQSNLLKEPDVVFMKWLSDKPAEWLQRMYAMLVSEPETKDIIYKLSNTNIVRLRDGTFSTGKNCHFPDEERKYIDIVPCVDHDILEVGNSNVRKKNTRKFLEELQVSDIGEYQLVEALLQKNYDSTNKPLVVNTYLDDIQRFLKLVNNESSSLEIFKNFRIFFGTDNYWHYANEIYLDSPYKETGMSDYYDIVGLPNGVTALAEFYTKLPKEILKKLIQFAKTLGARIHIPIKEVNCRSNPKWEYLREVPGSRYSSPLDEDYRIDDFNKIVAARNLRVSQLIWRTMCGHDSDDSRESILKAQYRKNRSNGPRESKSQIVYQLHNSEWVPQGDNKFVRPIFARAELLPNGFTFDPGWTWIKAIGFGKEEMEKRNRRDAAATELGLLPDDLDWIEEFKKLSQEQREGILKGLRRSQGQYTLPESEPTNPDRRSKGVAVSAKSAPKKEAEVRSRSISVGHHEVKVEASQYLQQQYVVDGNIICQVCKGPMPFKLDDGTDYFEKVEFLSELKMWHFQNYLALCPNHSAMFQHANSTKDLMKEMFSDLTSNELEVVLAQENMTIYFTKTHIADLKTIIEIEGGSTNLTDEDAMASELK